MAFLLSTSLAATACSTASTVYRRNDAPVTGELVSGSPRYVVVQGSSGGETRVPKSQIIDVDYPGGGAIGWGIGILAYGILNIAVGAPHCSEKGGAFCTGVFLPAAAGIGLMSWGFHVRSKAQDVVEASGPLDLRPRRAAPSDAAAEGRPAVEGRAADATTGPSAAHWSKPLPKAAAPVEPPAAPPPNWVPAPMPAPAPAAPPATSEPAGAPAPGRPTPTVRQQTDDE
jgi:hypothetical protein